MEYENITLNVGGIDVCTVDDDVPQGDFAQFFYFFFGENSAGNFFQFLTGTGFGLTAQTYPLSSFSNQNRSESRILVN